MAWLTFFCSRLPATTLATGAILSLLLTACATSNPEMEREGRKSAAQLEFSAASLLRVADNLIKANDYSSALRIYQDILEKDPQNIDALLGQGELLLTIGAPREAAARFQAVTRLAQQDGRGDAGLARALTQMGEAEAALPHFTAALEKGVETATLHNHYGVALDLLNRHQEAQVEYGRGLDKAQNDLSILNNLGLSLTLSEDYPAAVRLLSDVASAAPNLLMARQNLALAYALSGDTATALRITTIPGDAATTSALHSYINSIVSLPKDLRAKAIFNGLESVADALPKPAPAPVLAEPAEAAPAQETVKTSAPAVVDVTTRAETPETLPDAEGKIAAPPAAPVAEEAGETSPDSSATSAYMVQLGAYPDEKYARAGWKKFQKKAPDLVTGEPVLAQKDDLIRLGVAAADRDAARALCASLKEAGIECMVRRLPGNPNE